MRSRNWMLLIFVAAVAFALTTSTAWAVQQSEAEGGKAKVKLPAAVAKAIKDNRPDAEIDRMDVEKEGGIALYDIEFKAGKGEIEVAEDGTVMDIAAIIEMKDVPKAAMAAIQKAATGAKIKQLERSEVRAELKMEGEKGTIVKLATFKHIYEAELEKGGQTGEVQVDPDGKVVEELKWSAAGSKEKEEKSAKQEKAKPTKKK